MGTILKFLFFIMFAIIAYLAIEAYSGEKLVNRETAAALKENVREDTRKLIENGLDVAGESLNAVKEDTREAVHGYIKKKKTESVAKDIP